MPHFQWKMWYFYSYMQIVPEKFGKYAIVAYLCTTLGQ